MVGFVVTPTTASSFISRASSPVSSIVRESESIQTDWPRLLSLCRFDSAMTHLPLHTVMGEPMVPPWTPPLLVQRGVSAAA